MKPLRTWLIDAWQEVRAIATILRLIIIFKLSQLWQTVSSWIGRRILALISYFGK